MVLAVNCNRWVYTIDDVQHCGSSQYRRQITHKLRICNGIYTIRDVDITITLILSKTKTQMSLRLLGKNIMLITRNDREENGFASPENLKTNVVILKP